MFVCSEKKNKKFRECVRLPNSSDEKKILCTEKTWKLRKMLEDKRDK